MHFIHMGKRLLNGEARPSCCNSILEKMEGHIISRLSSGMFRVRFLDFKMVHSTIGPKSSWGIQSDGRGQFWLKWEVKRKLA